MRVARVRAPVFLRSRSVGPIRMGTAGAFARSAVRHVWMWLQRCRARAGERRALARLTDWDLRDIGLSRADAQSETEKWPWRP
jgi:uncharacterized protein YjiS (DUF1127 family)